MNTHLEIETMFYEFDNNDYPEIYEIKVENNVCILQHDYANKESDAIKIAEKLMADWDSGVQSYIAMMIESIWQDNAFCQ